MKKILRKIQTVVSVLVPVLVVLLSGLVFLSTKDNLNGWRLLVVKSGSMEPTIKTGSLVMIKTADQYGKDDVVTYQSRSNQLITHRIVEEVKENSETEFKTKGDFNDVVDQDLVSDDSIVGRLQFSIPYIGYVLSFAKTQLGLILLLVIPGTLIIYDEILNIKKNIKQLRSQNKKNEKD